MCASLWFHSGTVTGKNVCPQESREPRGMAMKIPDTLCETYVEGFSGLEAARILESGFPFGKLGLIDITPNGEGGL